MRVPGGTGMTRAEARLPWQVSGPPRPPPSARQCLRLTISAKLSLPATARTMTSPPSPPSPPSGPPLGTYFSRRKLQHPAPPSPPFTNTVTRSTNMMIHWRIRYQKTIQSLYDIRPSENRALRHVRYEEFRCAVARSLSWFLERATPLAVLPRSLVLL